MAEVAHSPAASPWEKRAGKGTYPEHDQYFREMPRETESKAANGSKLAGGAVGTTSGVGSPQPKDEQPKQQQQQQQQEQEQPKDADESVMNGHNAPSVTKSDYRSAVPAEEDDDEENKQHPQFSNGNLPEEELTPEDAVDSRQSKVEDAAEKKADDGSKAGDTEKLDAADDAAPPKLGFQAPSATEGRKPSDADQWVSAVDDRDMKEAEPEPMGDDIGSKAGEAVEKGEEKADDTASKAGAGGATSKAGSAVKYGVGKLGSAVGMVGDAAKKGEQKTGDVAKEGGEKLSETETQVGDKASETTTQAGNKARETEAQAGETVEAGKDKLAETGAESKDKVGEAAEETKDKLGDANETAKDKPDATTDEAKDKLGETTEGGSSKLEETKAQAGETAKDVKGKAEDATSKAGEETAEGAEAATADAGEKVDEAAEDAASKVDFSVLKGGKVNKGGNVVNGDGKVMGRIKEGVLAHLVGKRVDETGAIWNDSGAVIGRAEPIPADELEAMTKASGPFEAFPDAVVNAKGMVVFEGEEIGKVVEGDAKKLRGMKVDPDGDILDRSGNVVGRAERWEAEPEPEPEPEPEVDRSILAGKRVNKAGNVVDGTGTIFGRVVEGEVRRMVGRMCDKKGNVLSESGDVIGRAEVVSEGEREGSKEGPFAELSGLTVTREGKVVTPGGDVVGRLVKGDAKTLAGRAVDEDGDVVDKNGNVLGSAERWEEPEVEKRRNPLAGRRVNREGNVVDQDGNLVGKLTSGQLSICSGKEIDDDGDVVDSKGNTIGHVSLLEDIPPEPVEEESPEDKAKREQDEKDQQLAKQMSMVLTQVLDKVKPICDMITRKIEKADRTPKEDLDEEELVREVRPLIEEGGKILQEANGVIRGLDPDGRIQANAKHKAATREATPEEYHLADILKELTGTVTKCIEDAKKRLEGMPHAKKELNPLWGLLSEPLFQILAAVGLLLNGVLGLVGRLLSGLGLGGLVDSLLGGLGVKQILQSLGIGSLTDSLTGKNQKKKSGGLLGLGG